MMMNNYSIVFYDYIGTTLYNMVLNDFTKLALLEANLRFVEFKISSDDKDVLKLLESKDIDNINFGIEILRNRNLIIYENSVKE